MSSNDFIKGVKIYVRDAAIEDTVEFIKKPPGRKPRKRHVELSTWFNGLSSEDKQMVSSIMEEAVDSALFGLFSVLDGIRTIETSEEKTSFELYAVRGDQRTLINDEYIDSLHDLYNEYTNPED